MCTRIWCVRPGFQPAFERGVRAEALAQAVVRDRVAAVLAHGHADAVARMAVDRPRSPCRRRPARRPRRPGTGDARRARTAARPARCAPRSVRATTMTPGGVLVEAVHDAGARQRRQRRVAVQQRVDQRAGRVAGARDARPGPAGLSSTKTSRPRTGRRAGCPRARRGSARRGRRSSATDSPPRTGSRGAHRLPSSRASPDLIHSARRERENSGNSSASDRVETAARGLVGDDARCAAASLRRTGSLGVMRRLRFSRRRHGRVRRGSADWYYRRFVPSRRPSRTCVPPMTPRSMPAPPPRCSCCCGPGARRCSGCAPIEQACSRTRTPTRALPVEQLYDKAPRADARTATGPARPRPTSAWSRSTRTARTPSRR